MAIVTQYFLTIGFGDSRKKTTPVRLRLDPTDALAWLGAADAAARDATAVGVLADRIADISLANRMYTSVSLEDIDDSATFPLATDEIYNFDKITYQYKGALDNYVASFPARDMADINVGPDAVTIPINTAAGASAEIDALTTAFNNVVMCKNGVVATVTGAYVSS